MSDPVRASGAALPPTWRLAPATSQQDLVMLEPNETAQDHAREPQIGAARGSNRPRERRIDCEGPPRWMEAPGSARGGGRGGSDRGPRDRPLDAA